MYSQCNRSLLIKNSYISLTTEDAAKHVVCWCLLSNYSFKQYIGLSYMQPVWTQIRLVHLEQSDLGRTRLFANEFRISVASH